MGNLQKTANRLIYRIYEDCFMPSRIDEYERMLEKMASAGYVFLTVEDFARHVRQGIALPKLTAVLRHDVDHDNRTATFMHEVESRLEIAASYYFRLCTLDVKLMQSIASQGSEASYHFEEIATVAKRRALGNRAAVYRHLDEARELFQTNLSRLRTTTGLAMRVVASHGDFINRRLDVLNHVLLTPALREELGILAEAYDEDLARPLTARVSDCQPPHYWRPTSPHNAIASHSPCIYILVHPKHWHVNLRTNFQASATRVWEDVSYEFRKRIA